MFHRTDRTLPLLAVFLLLMLGRAVFYGRLTYAFLLWNVFLAAVPCCAALLFDMQERRGGTRALPVLLGGIWLLFLPNSFYVLTDFIHLTVPRGGAYRSIPTQFDVLLFGSAAWLGFLYGFRSLRLVERAVLARSPRFGRAFAPAVLTLAALGVALGRVGRLNSWDVLTDPAALGGTASQIIQSPLEAVPLLLYVAAGAAFLIALYAGVGGREREATPLSA